MNCRSAEPLFSSYVEDELSQKERHELEGHLEECSRCSAAVQEMRATIDLLGALPSYETGPAFEEEVMDRIRSGEALRPSLVEWLSELLTPVRLRPLFLAGAAGCAIWIATFVGNPVTYVSRLAHGNDARPGATSSTSTVASTAPAVPVTKAVTPAPTPMPPGEVVASAPSLPRAASSSRSTPLEEGATAFAPAADSARANGSAPYQDEYILDQFYLNRSGEDGVHSIVPVSGRTTDDVYITF